MNPEKKSERPERREAAFTGGAGAIPRGVEVLLKKASVDPQFRALLLEQRAEVARTIDLELTDTERQMVAGIPARQLEQIIRRTKVKPEHRAAFLGDVGRLMVAPVVGMGALSLTVTCTAGIAPDEVRRREAALQGANDPNATDPSLSPGQHQPGGAAPQEDISRGLRPD